MYKVTLSEGYTEFAFIFCSIESAGKFMEDAMLASVSNIELTVCIYHPEEESEVESNDTN